MMEEKKKRKQLWEQMEKYFSMTTEIRTLEMVTINTFRIHLKV